MNLVIDNHPFQYETEKLLRVFFPSTKIAVTDRRNNEADCVVTSLRPLPGGASLRVSYALLGKTAEKAQDVSAAECAFGEREADLYERRMVQLLYDLLRALTGYTPPWGILTGVRPAKLMLTLSNRFGEEAATGYFRTELRVSAEKTALALSVAKTEMPITLESGPRSFSLYVSIPFCPSRCSYCSFVSHSNEQAKKLMPRYIDLLCRELEATAALAKQRDLHLETVYIGGGTPTALSAEGLRTVTDAIRANFELTPQTEFTIEAGRPDSVSDEKFDVITAAGATRISINPQTFSDDVLRTIGRRHTSAQTEEALRMARRHGFCNINMDLIAGLPTDTPASFRQTLEKTLSFSPENVTVHTLAHKRASTLVTRQLETGSVEAAEEMLSYAMRRLTEEGYRPYYMYRQSNCLGNLENVGWAKPGYACRYNIFMMEETHTVLAVGAGAVTKLRSPFSVDLERIFNHKYPYEYIDRFDELIERKGRILTFYDEVFAGEGA